MNVPMKMNAGTTYGTDTSPENNYGLGSSYRSTSQLSQQAKAAAATPSVWWLVLFAIALGVL